MKKLFSLFMLPVMVLTLSLTVIPSLKAAGDEPDKKTDKKKGSKKKKKTDDAAPKS